jgi:dolichol-phosphate mannosyltransferase
MPARVSGDAPVYSLVLPVLNERHVIPQLADQLSSLMHHLDGNAEVIFVDDGSTDGSGDLLAELAARDQRYRLVRLSRNFGHQIAITAGLDFARGDAIVVMDSDLQDPPELVLDLAARWREGYDIVYAVRGSRVGESRFKRGTASLYYRLLRRMSEVDVPLDVGDFRLVDRRALEAFRLMRESNRYVRGMFSWIGLHQTGVEYRRSARAGGKTKYPLRRMLRFAVDGVVGFSDAPLRLALNLGFIVSVISFLVAFAAIVARVTGHFAVPGWASILVAVAFIGGVQLVVLGIMGEYIARIHAEVKGRPLYVVTDLVNIPEPLDMPTRAAIVAPRESSP